MKFFNRRPENNRQPLENLSAEMENHAEPTGHVHPNYRHWTWFRPTNLQQDNKR